MTLKKVIAIGLAAAFCLMGCQPANRPPADQTTPNPNQEIDYTQRVRNTDPQNPQKAYPQQTPVPQADNNTQQNATPQNTANRLESIAKRVPEVRDATAISAGNFTIVGLDLDDKVKRDRIGTIKYTVAQSLKNDPQGMNALVTADADIVERVRKVNQHIRDGRPITGFMDELASIAARIAPQPNNDIPNRAE